MRQPHRQDAAPSTAADRCPPDADPSVRFLGPVGPAGLRPDPPRPNGFPVPGNVAEAESSADRSTAADDDASVGGTTDHRRDHVTVGEEAVSGDEQRSAVGQDHRTSMRAPPGRAPCSPHTESWDTTFQLLVVNLAVQRRTDPAEVLTSLDGPVSTESREDEAWFSRLQLTAVIGPLLQRKVSGTLFPAPFTPDVKTGPVPPAPLVGSGTVTAVSDSRPGHGRVRDHIPQQDVSPPRDDRCPADDRFGSSPPVVGDVPARGRPRSSHAPVRRTAHPFGSGRVEDHRPQRVGEPLPHPSTLPDERGQPAAPRSEVTP